MRNKENISKILDEVAHELKQKFEDYRGMYLFGSYSDGKQNNDSDIDIALIFDRQIDQAFEDAVTGIIYDYDIKYGVLIDNHIINKDEFSLNTQAIHKEIHDHGIFYGS